MVVGGLAALAESFELASQAYASAAGIERDEDWFALKLQEELGELTQAWVKATGRGRTHGVDAGELRIRLADEAADLFGHVLLFAHRNSVDLPAAIERKWRFHPEAP